MIDEKSDFLAKAQEALEGAQCAVENHRYNNAANRAYYACFLAAIAALIDAHVRPEGSWGHEYVQAQFSGLLIRRRKLYSATLGSVLSDNLETRARADYRPSSVSEKDAKRAVARARSFVQMVAERIGGRV